MKTFFKVLMYILGFPLMIGAVVYASWPIIEAGKTYGIYIFAGIGLTVVLGLLYLVAGLITWNASRKAKTVTAIRKATAALVICGVVLTTGVWFAVDQVLPDILDDATSGTITYEDVMYDYINKAEYHNLLLTKFIEMNLANGNLNEAYREQYFEEGYRNEEVKNLIHTNYKSLNEDGFNTFVGPWLDLANDDRMTIPTIVHLVINDRLESTEDPEKEDIIFIYKGEGREAAGKTESPIRWTILDMQEGALTFDLEVVKMISGMEEGQLKTILTNLLTTNQGVTLGENLINNILKALNAAIKDEALAGSVITIGVDIIAPNEAEEKGANPGTVSISITPASESRGVWDYTHMAWLDSNHLLFMVITLFPARYIILCFSGLIVILSLIIGVIREKQYGKKIVEAAAEEEEKPAAAPQRPEKEFFSPYIKACYASFNNFETRGSLNLPKSIDPHDYN